MYQTPSAWLKYIQFLFVNYTSIEPKTKSWRLKHKRTAWDHLQLSGASVVLFSYRTAGGKNNPYSHPQIRVKCPPHFLSQHSVSFIFDSGSLFKSSYLKKKVIAFIFWSTFKCPGNRADSRVPMSHLPTHSCPYFCIQGDFPYTRWASMGTLSLIRVLNLH